MWAASARSARLPVQSPPATSTASTPLASARVRRRTPRERPAAVSRGRYVTPSIVPACRNGSPGSGRPRRRQGLGAAELAGGFRAHLLHGVRLLVGVALLRPRVRL